MSLSTLGEQPAPVGADEEGNPAATTKTNRIQKEIVKQLLYQQMPADAPESRFRRISRFPRWREFGLALFVGLVLFVLMVAAGLDRPVIALTGVDPVERPGWSRTPLVYLALAAILIGAVYLVRLLLHDKVRIEQVTAGPASITLPPRSSSYFDEYLDEIVYLFETNGRDIVILEDLDRFDDPLIFETLRSLNNLLNTAKQLKGRRVRFIYALRDSIFEKLGRDENNAITDEAKAELVRANRTKFFDLVVPVVPFITHKNARDHMHRLLTGRWHSISKELVDLAARHVADMRLIYNIVNEYEVFKHQLIDVATPVPQLDEERLLAMVLFKNVHMADFEAIRLGESSLDKLYDVWRALVSANLQRLRVESTKLHERIERDEAAEERAGELAARLQARVDAIVRASSPQGFTVSDQLHVSGEVVSPAELRTAKFWRDLLQGNGSIVLHVRDGYGYQRQLLFSAPVLSDLLGTSLDLDEWAARSATADKDSLERIERDVHFLQHHTWGDLVDRPQFKYRTTEGENALTFRQWLDRLLPSQLAVDLVAQKYITSYFSLHVSSFYGELIRPDAMTYLMRNVDRGTPDADYPLDAEDITAILRDRGTGVLRDRSMYNVSILNHLLQEDADRAKVVVKRLADWGPKERAFVDHYLGAGVAKAALVEQLTPLR
ncbi:hypothetical protein DLJ47_33330 [Micromonospora sp. S4605]|nr:hypothetical protein [Micromonospora sp. S4605]PWU46068.1 hypothetical protein DLJ47_33330 [Micromonospora sp. S4605]